MKKFILVAMMCLLPIAAYTITNPLGQGMVNSPAFNKGNYGIDTSADSILYGFVSTNSDTSNFYWPYTYVISSAANSGNITVKWILDGTVNRQLILAPGASVADYLITDSLFILKGVVTDTVQYGGCYNQ